MFVRAAGVLQGSVEEQVLKPIRAAGVAITTRESTGYEVSRQNRDTDRDALAIRIVAG
jgi:hypothetical protein